MTPHYGADYLVAHHQRIQQIGGVIQMPRGNKRRVPQSSPQKTTTSTCEDKRMQRCPGPLSNRPRGAPPGMNPDRMFLIAKRLGLVRRCADRWRQACAAPHPRRYLGRSQATSRDAVLRSSAVVNRFCRVFWESQINRYNYLRGRKEIDEKLMCSETPTAGTRPAIYAFEAWSCDLNVEELKVKSNTMGPNYMS